MNKYLFTAILVVVTITCGCTSNTEQVASERETVVTFVVDCTDSELFETIEQDFRTNLNSFFHNTKLNQLDYGQKLTVKMLPLESSGTVLAKRASIGPASKNMSKRQAALCRDTRPLSQLIASELDVYKKLSESDIKSSSILETIMKTFMEMNPEAEREVVVLLSDGIEYSAYLNMYKSSVPTSDEAVEKLGKKLDPIVLQGAISRIKQKMPVVIIVLKKSDKVNAIDLKQFYSKFFCNILGITAENVMFVDNLGNNILMPKKP